MRWILGDEWGSDLRSKIMSRVQMGLRWNLGLRPRPDSESDLRFEVSIARRVEVGVGGGLGQRLATEAFEDKVCVGIEVKVSSRVETGAEVLDGARFWDECILVVNMEEQIRVGIESGPESRCRTLSLPPRHPGDGHRAGSTYRGTWVSHRTPYPCWSRWALEEEAELKIPQDQDWGVALEMSMIVPRPLPPPGSHSGAHTPGLSSQPPADGLGHRHLS